jgi:hypothetical protein
MCICFGLSKDKKQERDKKIKPEKILHQEFCWRNRYPQRGNVDNGFAAGMRGKPTATKKADLSLPSKRF